MTIAQTYNAPDFFAQGGNLNVASAVYNFDITVGADAGTTVTINIQALQGGGDEIDTIATFFAFLSDDADGIGVSAAAPDGGVAAGTDGEIIAAVVADLVFLLQTEADGDLDLVLTETGTATWYLVLIDAYGRMHVSDAITFAA